MHAWARGAFGGLGPWVLAAGCATAGEPRSPTLDVDTTSDGSTGGLSIGSLVTGIESLTADGPSSADTHDGESTTGAASSDTTTGDGSTDGGSSDTGGGPPLPAYCDDPIPAAGTEPLIDDLELETGQIMPDDQIPDIDGRVGYWFTYNDGSPAGMQTPTPGSFQPSVGGAAGTSYSAGTFGDGFLLWGAGMGVKLNNAFDGDCPYDASTYDGITFLARGDTTVRLSVTTRATHPIEQGGTCDPERGQCSDSFGMSLALTPEWSVYTVAWTDLLQQGWGIPAEFDPGEIIEIQWQVPEAAPFDVQVDELAFWSP